MDVEDFYEVLGVERDADATTIRQAFKKLALAHHPDKVSEENREEAEIRFKVISEAYETLSNEESRMIYDAQAEFGGANDWQDFYAGPQDDFFGFNSQFSSGFNAPPPRPQSMRRTEDVVFEVLLTLEDVFKGKMIKLSSQRQVLCRRCNGSGGRQAAAKRTCNTCNGFGTTRKSYLAGPGIMSTATVLCPVCKGDGRVYRDKDLCRRCKGGKTQPVKTIIEVYIPKGVKNRHRIIVKGHSDEEPSKVPGDLVILVLVNPDHSTFRREGADLYATSQITLKEALTGFSRPLVTHLDGRKLKPTIARGDIIRPGSILRIPGEGLILENPSNGSETIGDLFIQMDVTFPESIDQHILDKLATLLSVDSDLESDRSDDTLEETGFVKNTFAKTKESLVPDDSIDVEHEVLDESDLPAYQEDVNDEPEAADRENSNNGFDFNSYGTSANGSVPGCTTM